MKVSRLLVLVLLGISVSTTVISCGGSSSGTGSKRYEGTIETRDGTPQAGVLVTILETGQQVASDASGYFAFDSVTAPNEITLSFEGAQVHDAVTLSAPEEYDEVNLQLTVDAESGEISDTQISGHADTAATSSNGSASDSNDESSSQQSSSSDSVDGSASSSSISSSAGEDDNGTSSSLGGSVATSTDSENSSTDSDGSSSSSNDTDNSSSVIGVEHSFASATRN